MALRAMRRLLSPPLPQSAPAPHPSPSRTPVARIPKESE